MQPLFVALLPDKGGENLVLFFIFQPPRPLGTPPISSTMRAEGED